MTNTQGMSDEALKTRLSTSTDGVSSSMLGSRSQSQRESMKKRLEMPIGERPAATAVRKAAPASRPNRTAATSVQVPQTAAYNSYIQSVETGESDCEDSKVQRGERPPIFGAVVERPRQASSVTAKPSDRSSTRPVSRFAKLRQLAPPSGQGFPSLDRPLGSFVVKKPMVPAAPSTSARGSGDLASPSPNLTPRADMASSIDNLRHESAKDAQAMLLHLSLSEIREKQQELESTLSPDMVKFLRARATRNAAPASTSTLENAEPANKDETTPIVEEGDASLYEKERLAQVLSSIRTYEEMDAALAAELGNEDPISEILPDREDDFELACDLIRSSAPRQNLWAVKVVAERLKHDLLTGCTCSLSDAADSDAPWPYPNLLPVSLRCLLDSSSISRPNGHLLCTFVLQSLYRLLELRAHPSHVVDVTGARRSSGDIFQLYYMSDAVPTPQVSSCYSSTPVATTLSGENEPIAYTASSSATSANSDAEAFQRDPMWTLLSKMRILPRLSHILTARLPYDLPDDALFAICGILAMVAQRSPGAATAIVSHESLLPRILYLTIEVNNDQLSSANPRLGLAAMILLSTLSRQSRAAAERLGVGNTILRLLAEESSGSLSFQLKQQALILWRTLTRYGLCLSLLQPVLTLAASSATIGHGEDSLAADYFAAFASVCDAASTVAAFSETDKVTKEDFELTMHARSWFSSFLKLAIRHVASAMCEADQRMTEKLKLKASCVRFIESYIHLFTSKNGPSNEDGGGLLFEDDWSTIQSSIGSLIESKAIQVSLETVFASLSTSSEIPLEHEATCFALVYSLVHFVKSISESALVGALDQMIEAEIVGLPSAMSLDNDVRLGRACLGWRNQTLAIMISSIISKGSRSLVGLRSCTYFLIGKLQLGEESLAAILFSHDGLFLPKEAEGSTMSNSPLSTVLMRELCRGTNQLNHSFKILGGLGVDSSGDGSLGLLTLLSEAEGTNKVQNNLIPMDMLWLWQSLCGSVFNEDADCNEALQVLNTSLQIILELESNSDPYALGLPVGSKLYFVVAMCLHPESVYTDERIETLASQLVDLYVRKDEGVGESFVCTCRRHSSSSQSSGTVNDTLKELQDSKMKESLQSIEDLVSDLCESFSETGAQYPFFVRCMRVFLMPSFPTKIRCTVLRRLSGLYHLLTIEGESVADLLAIYIRSDSGSVDLSKRDSDEWLDMLAMAVLKETDMRNHIGLVPLVAVAALVKDLVISLRRPTSLSSCRRRLEQLDRQNLIRILNAATSFLSGSRSLEDLVKACIGSADSLDVALPAGPRSGDRALDLDATFAFLCDVDRGKASIRYDS